MMISPTVLTWSLIAEMSAARLPACQPSKPWKLLNAWSTLLLQAFPFLPEDYWENSFKKLVCLIFDVVWRFHRLLQCRKFLCIWWSWCWTSCHHVLIDEKIDIGHFAKRRQGWNKYEWWEAMFISLQSCLHRSYIHMTRCHENLQMVGRTPKN